MSAQSLPGSYFNIFLCISLSLLTYISPSNNLKYLDEEAGEMAQRLRTLIAFVVDLSLLSLTHNSVTPVKGDLMPSSDLCGYT